MNWAIGMDMYTLMCVKLMTNKNLLYKKINKIKLKKKRNICRHLHMYVYTHTHIHIYRVSLFLIFIFYLFLYQNGAEKKQLVP